MNQKVTLISYTAPTEAMAQRGLECSEDILSYCARVSSPQNQTNFNTAAKLLSYCMRKSHWSVFEMVDVTFEICTTRDIGRQILRHRSNAFAEFSQRYAEVDADSFIYREARLQDTTNRQNSVETDDQELKDWWHQAQKEVIELATAKYKQALQKGMAKEQARCVLPEGNTPTVMFMKGSLRSWIHYCLLRRANGTQKEHSLIAAEIWEILKKRYEFLAEID